MSEVRESREEEFGTSTYIHVYIYVVTLPHIHLCCYIVKYLCHNPVPDTFADEFGQPDALEYHMNVDSHLRQSRFLEVFSFSRCVIAQFHSFSLVCALFSMSSVGISW